MSLKPLSEIENPPTIIVSQPRRHGKTATVVTASDNFPGFNNTGIGLDIHSTVSFAEWEAYGKHLSKQYSGLQWAIGDWVNFGETHYGEKYAQALDDTLFAYGTLRNYASVAARIPRHLRNPSLRFHQIKHVAPLEYSEQEKIIEFAARHKLTGDDILELVWKIQNRQPAPKAVEGRVTKAYKQEDGSYVVIVLPAGHEPFIAGQTVTLKAKNES